MITLTEAIDFIKASYPQRLIIQDDYDIDARAYFNKEHPEFLYRGESSIWPQTRSTFSRHQLSKQSIFPGINYWLTGKHMQLGFQLNHFSLYFFLREAIGGISCIVDDNTSIKTDQSIAGLLQHYGFDTSFIDVTSDINVAAFFGSCDAKPDGFGQIMVLPTITMQTRFFDLSNEKANRPKKQSAYALLTSEEFDLKSHQFQQEYRSIWIKYRITKDDIGKFLFPELLSLEKDQGAELIVDWYNAHIRTNENVLPEVKIYFKKKVDLLIDHNTTK